MGITIHQSVYAQDDSSRVLMKFPKPALPSLEGAFLFTGSPLSAFDQTGSGKTLTPRGTPIFKGTEFGIECTKLNDFVTNITEKLDYTVITVGRHTQDLTPNENAFVLSCFDDDTVDEPRGSVISIQGVTASNLLRTNLVTNAQINATPTTTQLVSVSMDAVTGLDADRPRYRLSAMQADSAANRFRGWHSNGYDPNTPLTWTFDNSQAGASRNLANRRLGGNWIIGGTPDGSSAITSSAQVVYAAFYAGLLTEAQLKAEYLCIKEVLGLHGITV